MNLAIVVDSSVAYKWLSPIEEDSVAEAEALLDAQEVGTALLVAPSHLRVELANALRYSKLPQDATLAFVEELDSLDLELFEATAARLEAAVSLAYRHRISVYDALFLQLAEELDCPLVAADRRAFSGIETDVEIRLL